MRSSTQTWINLLKSDDILIIKKNLLMRSLYILLHWPMINLILLISLNGLSRQFASSLPENVMDGYGCDYFNSQRLHGRISITSKALPFNKLMVAMLEHKNRTHDQM